ncbi:hypothetical protein ABZ070_10175 [Streptomyces sp. NPDC006283]|uniref:hypothetical protein n=1 Tax=Streptomyces sp. NPDC006283 TaxID=3156741 RepID=UPI0033AA74B5
MPDPYRRLTAAVVEIGTQLQRIADHMRTPVDAGETTGVAEARAELTRSENARDYLRRRVKIAETELRTLRSGILALGGDPTTIQNLWAQISLRNRQWRETKLERDTLRRWLDGDSLRTIDEMVDEHAKLSDRARAAEEQRDQLAAALREVLGLFAPVLVNGKCAFYQANEQPIAPQDYQRWRAVLTQPATAEQP